MMLREKRVIIDIIDYAFLCCFISIPFIIPFSIFGLSKKYWGRFEGTMCEQRFKTAAQMGFIFYVAFAFAEGIFHPLLRLLILYLKRKRVRGIIYIYLEMVIVDLLVFAYGIFFVVLAFLAWKMDQDIKCGVLADFMYFYDIYLIPFLSILALVFLAMVIYITANIMTGKGIPRMRMVKI